MTKEGYAMPWVFSTGYQSAVCGWSDMYIVGDNNFLYNHQNISQRIVNSMPSYVTFKGILFNNTATTLIS
jgi:hypothetical protein